MYFGAGNRGIKPTGSEKTSASIPVGRISENSDALSVTSTGSSLFLPPMNRLKKETPFLSHVMQDLVLGGPVLTRTESAPMRVAGDCTAWYIICTARCT